MVCLLVLRYLCLNICVSVCFCVDVKPIANDIPLRDISLHVHLYAPYIREYYIIFARDRIHKSGLHPASSLDHYSSVCVYVVFLLPFYVYIFFLLLITIYFMSIWFSMILNVRTATTAFTMWLIHVYSLRLHALADNRPHRANLFS